MADLRVFSFGGGVQSTAALVLAAQRRIDFGVFLFANVGDDTEDAHTLAYIDRYAKPYAAAHGIQLIQLRRIRRDGTAETLCGRLTSPGHGRCRSRCEWTKARPAPDRGSTSKSGCWAGGSKVHPASPAWPATVGIGISLDEIWRQNNRRAEPYERPVYPLLIQESPPRRSDCQRIINLAGLPVPEVGRLVLPYHRPQWWAEIRQDRPDLFARACALEDLLNQRRHPLGKDPVWLTRYARPLAEGIGAGPDTLPGLDNLAGGQDDQQGDICDSWRCSS